MSTLVMQAPHRKPVPGYAPPAAAAAASTGPGPGLPYAPVQSRAHSRTRTNSSSAMPTASQLAPQHPALPSTASSQYNVPQQQQQQQASHYAAQQSNRRTLSTATSSTSSSLTPNLQQVPSNYSIRRSTSKGSNSSSLSPTSYVALMRKQKATVWCDRAQHEDPRILAAQRQAKMRAAAEVAGGHNHAAPRATSSSGGVVGGVRSKIRHHGAPKASAYNSANYAGGAGVPMRLSASEVDEGDSDDENTTKDYYGATASSRHAPRNASSRSSLGSGRRGYSGGGRLNSMYSNGSGTPPTHSPVEGMADLAEEQTPGPNDFRRHGDDYFSQPGGGNGDSSGGSGSGGGGVNSEESFGVVGGLPTRKKTVTQDEKHYSADELRRRGSVDDRTMTMSGVRLFVANPDLSD